MLGISLGKLLVLIAILVAVWYGFKYIGRLQEIERGERPHGKRTMSERMRKATRGKGQKSDKVVEDTEQCPVCKTYVAVGAPHDCKKDKCPY